MALKDNIVEAWNFNNSRIGQVNGIELLADGPDRYVKGKRGKAWSFNATSDAVLQTPFAGLLSTSSSISWSFWIKFPTVVVHTGVLVLDLARINNLSIAYGEITRLSGNIMHRATSGSKSLFSATVVQDLDWHHVAASFDEPTGASSLWLDTVEVFSAGWLGPTYDVELFTVGSNSVKGSLQTYDIDMLNVWDKGLVQTEVDELFNDGDGLEYPFTSTIAIHVARIGLFKIAGDGNVITGQSNEFITGHDHRIIPDSNIPNSAGYPTVSQYLQLEVVSNYLLIELNQSIIVTKESSPPAEIVFELTSGDPPASVTQWDQYEWTAEATKPITNAYSLDTLPNTFQWSAFGGVAIAYWETDENTTPGTYGPYRLIMEDGDGGSIQYDLTFEVIEFV